MRQKLLRPICLTCVTFDVEQIIDDEAAAGELFACFECQDVFYFLTDARPRVRRLALFELYSEQG